MGGFFRWWNLFGEHGQILVLGPRKGFPEVDLWVFPGSHAMIPEELDALAAWWLLGVLPA